MPEPLETTPLLRAAWMVGVLGHRKLPDPAPIEAVLERELRSLVKATQVRGGELHLLVSVATGTDLLAIRVARRLGLPVHLFLPLADEDFFEDFAEFPDALAEAKAALAEARAHLERDSVTVVPTSRRRPECYFDTDVRLIESADILISIWDGLPTDRLGGTGQLVSLGMAMQKPVVSIHPTSLTVSLEHHEPRTWPPVDEQWEWIEKQEIVAPAPGCATDQERSNTIKTRLSQVASAEAFDFRNAAQLLIVIGALGGLIGLTHGILAKRDSGSFVVVLQGVQLVLSLWVLRARWRLKRAALVEKWTKARISVEIWRGLAASLPFSDPFRPAAGYLVPEWRRFAVSLGLLINRYRLSQFALQPVPFVAFKEEYARDRLDNQYQYYAREQDKSERWVRRLPLLAKRCSQATPVFVGLAIVNRTANLGWTDHQLGMVAVTVLPAVLPIVAAVADGMVSTFDRQRRYDWFRDIALSLTQQKSVLEQLRTESSVRKLVERCERMLLDEALEWRYVTKKIKV